MASSVTLRFELLAENEPVLYAVTCVKDADDVVETYKVHLRYSTMEQFSRDMRTKYAMPHLPFPPKSNIMQLCRPWDLPSLEARRDGLARYFTALTENSEAWAAEETVALFYPPVALQNRATKAAPATAAPAGEPKKGFFADLITPGKGDSRRASALKEMLSFSTRLKIAEGANGHAESSGNSAATADAGDAPAAAAAIAVPPVGRRLSMMERAISGLEQMITPTKPKAAEEAEEAVSVATAAAMESLPPVKIVATAPVGQPL